MKLFICYSLFDKTWTYDLVGKLHDILEHDVLIDKQLIPSRNWWETICESIENAEVFIYVLTKKSQVSIYCKQQLDHAIALNKPILALMLNDCDPPSDKHQIQYLRISEEMPIEFLIFRIRAELMSIQQKIFEPESVSRPDIPMPDQKPEQIYEVFALAEEASSENNFLMAMQALLYIIEYASPESSGVAKQRLDKIFDNRMKTYITVKQLASNFATLNDAKAKWLSFQKKYGNYDPDNVENLLLKSKYNKSLYYSRSISLNVMPEPFEWIEIPGDEGILETDDFNVTLSIPTEDYWVSKYPVTNAQFRKFIETDGYKTQHLWTPDGWKACQDGWSCSANPDVNWHRSGKAWTEPLGWQDSRWNEDTQPIIGISWYEAVAFCLWLSELTGEKIMLPTENQWQYAAQGNDNRTFPWGNEWDRSKCRNSVDAGYDTSGITSPVTYYKGIGDSPFGVTDMVGNVWEYCLTDYENRINDVKRSFDKYVLRGGSYSSFKSRYLHCGFRRWCLPERRVFNNGFRIVWLN